MLKPTRVIQSLNHQVNSLKGITARVRSVPLRESKMDDNDLYSNLYSQDVTIATSLR